VAKDDKWTRHHQVGFFPDTKKKKNKKNEKGEGRRQKEEDIYKKRLNRRKDKQKNKVNCPSLAIILYCFDVFVCLSESGWSC